MQELSTSSKLKYIFSIPVIISALGYFVDIYDLLLFGIVRIPSLKALGLIPIQTELLSSMLKWSDC